MIRINLLGTSEPSGGGVSLDAGLGGAEPSERKGVLAGIVIMGAGVVAWFISLPLYALQQGFTQAQASGALVVAMIAAAVAQYPIGWISDHTDRRFVVIGLASISVVAALWMALDTAPSRGCYKSTKIPY